MKSDIKPFYGIVIIGSIRHITDSIKWLKKRVGIYICVIEIEELKIEKYLLDGYVCGERKVIQVEGKEYEIQKYQGEHQNEYLISEMKDGKVEGRCELFDSGLLTLSWIMKDGKRIGLTEYEKGKVLVKKGWESVLGEGDYRIIENNKEEMELVIRDKNDTMIYQGEFDEELNRHGKGLEYDENGKLKYEGYWKRDELICILREFRGDEMIEYEDCDNADVLNRIPLYIGGYNIVGGEFKRNGIGYLIDRENGTAMRECEWSYGKEVNGIDLFDGWYVKGMNESIRCVLNNEQPKEMVEEVLVSEKRFKITNSDELNSLNTSVTNLLIVYNCCNELTSLDLSEYKRLKSIEIGSDCFENAYTFRIVGLNELKSLKIGMNSFTKNKYGDSSSRSFHILSCIQLESIEIGRYSFSDYAGEFELRNLPKLSTIKIGMIGWESSNFFYSSFVINGIIYDIANE